MTNSNTLPLLLPLIVLGACTQQTSPVHERAASHEAQQLGIESYVVVAEDAGVSVTALDADREEVAELWRRQDGSRLELTTSEQMLEVDAQQEEPLSIDGRSGSELTTKDLSIVDLAAVIVHEPELSSFLSQDEFRKAGTSCETLKRWCAEGKKVNDLSDCLKYWDQCLGLPILS